MDNQFNFNISLSVLNHLGRNLYRNVITVIGEAISNSWDADATNVRSIPDVDTRLAERLASLEERIAQLESENFELKSRLLSLNYENDKVVEENRALKKENEALIQENEVLQDTNFELMKKLGIMD